MNQTILFSPVGGTDPVSTTNCYDGALLHISRVYRPDKIVMYMSKEMLDYQKEDDRYRYCLKRLDEMQHRQVTYEIIERPELTKVHEFDYFYQDFRSIISSLYKTMDETDTLLLNISSGTPAMKSGLLVLQTLGEFPAKLIQVATPDKHINEHIHKNYDVETLWELDEDNREDFENRCKEISCPTLSKIKKEEIIKKHIKVYDYKAAFDVAEDLPECETERYRELIRMAYYRLLLNFREVKQIEKEQGFICLPIKPQEQSERFEYALNMNIKLIKNEYADFVRSITPIVVDLYELILKKQFDVNLDDYTISIRMPKGKNRKQWDRNKLKGKIGDILNEAFRNKGGFSGKEIYSIHLKALILGLSNDEKLNKLVNEIGKAEEKIRNLAAHEIVSVNDKMIQQYTELNAQGIMNRIKQLFHYTGIPVRDEYWKSYDVMNDMILKKIDMLDDSVITEE